MAEARSAAESTVVELRYELGRSDWADAFRARGKTRGIRGRLRGLLVAVLFAASVWLISDSPSAAACAFVGSLLGLVARAGVLAARHAKVGAAMGAWTVTVGDSDEAVRFTGAHMETRRGWKSLGGYVETAAGFVLLSPAPHLLVVHYLPKRALGRDDTDRLRAVLDRRLPRRAARPPQH
ncbi:YcxB family protein [Streptomyces sp. NBC_01358]|uniref:YcxB family protein n=1 Tax=Streptomyces sp. NBC_01358 TaxID=2903837 RepID=UPI002E30BD64|nr:YcxB family protein [Streptomyces sp. NBC_01358]